MRKLLLAYTTLILVFAGSCINMDKRAMIKLTPVLYVDEIEKNLPFWVERLGFEKTVEVPHEDRLGFVMLQKGNVEIMYQSMASLEKEIPAVIENAKNSRNFLYIEVGDLEEVISKLDGMEVVVPKRKTFYGATEIAYRDPSGHIICFAQMGH